MIGQTSIAKPSLLQKLLSGNQTSDDKALKMVVDVFEEGGANLNKKVDIKDQKLFNEVRIQVRELFWSVLIKSEGKQNGELTTTIKLNNQSRNLIFKRVGDSVEFYFGDATANKVKLEGTDFDLLVRKLGFSSSESDQSNTTDTSSSGSELSRSETVNNFDMDALHKRLAKLEHEERLTQLYNEMEKSVTYKGGPVSRSLNGAYASAGSRSSTSARASSGAHTPINAGTPGTQTPINSQTPCGSHHDRMIRERDEQMQMRSEWGRRLELEKKYEQQLQAKEAGKSQEAAQNKAVNLVNS